MGRSNWGETAWCNALYHRLRQTGRVQMDDRPTTDQLIRIAATMEDTDLLAAHNLGAKGLQWFRERTPDELIIPSYYVDALRPDEV